jgi:hypothetical protein
MTTSARKQVSNGSDFTGPAKASQRIIQCPDCQTKFALSPQAVQGLDSPRFHCSRCDHIFTLRAEEVGSARAAAFPLAAGASSSEFPEISPTEASVASQLPQDDVPWEHAQEGFSIDHDATDYGATQLAAADYSALEALPVEPGLPADSDNERFSEEAARFDASIQEIASESEPTFTPTVTSTVTPTVSRASSLAGTVQGLSMPQSYESKFSIRAPHESLAEHEDSSAGATQLRLHLGARPSISRQLSQESAGEQTAILPASALSPAMTAAVPSALLARVPAALPRLRWRSLGLLLMPLGIFMLLLLGAAIFSGRYPSIAEGLVDSVFVAPYQVAPAGVQVAQLKLKFVTLDGGESVALLSGQIMNDTSQDFRDVVLEALAFDMRGAVLATQRVHKEHSLAKSRVKALTPEMIELIQSGASASDTRSTSVLKAGTREDFSIALLPSSVDFSQINTYSARVYSVRAVAP